MPRLVQIFCFSIEKYSIFSVFQPIFNESVPSPCCRSDEVQRSLELLDSVLSEFDDLENGNLAAGSAPGPPTGTDLTSTY